MMEYPVCKLVAADYIDNPKVLNKQCLDAFIYIKVPEAIAQNCALIGVAEVVPKFKRLDDYVDAFVPQEKYPWIRVQSDKLNLTPGMHVYDLEYVDTLPQCLYIQHIFCKMMIRRNHIFI